MNREYFQKVESYATKRGFPVLSREANKIEWWEWVDYFAYVGLPKSAEMMASGMATFTVPTLSPRDFDPVRAAIAVEAAQKRRDRMRRLSKEERAEIVQRHRPMYRSEAKAKARELSESDDERNRRLAREILEEGKRRYEATQSKPPEATGEEGQAATGGS